MTNYLNIPKINPFWFIKDVANKGKHYGDRWAKDLIRVYERAIFYKQKWKAGDTTKLQIESTIAPAGMQILDAHANVVYTIGWTPVFVTPTYTVYELLLDFAAAGFNSGTFFLYIKATFGDIAWAAISEPIEIKAEWPGTELIEYTNSFNDYGVAWTATGILMRFRCELDIRDYNPERERTAHVSQTANVSTLYGVPSDSYKLYVGGTGYDVGVPYYILNIVNRITLCDYLNIGGKILQCAADAKWERQPVKGYALFTADIGVVDAINQYSTQFMQTTNPLAPGVVVGYDIDTGFFGPGSLVPVLDIETNE